MCGDERLACDETFVPLKFLAMSIQQRLRESGRKQADIARALGVSEGTVSKWVAGAVPADRLADFAQVTGIPAAELRPDLAEAFGVTPPASARQEAA